MAKLIFISGGGSGTGGAGYDFLFDPGAAQNPEINLYSSWTDLIAAINPPSLPLGAPPVITFAASFVVPLAGMPVTGWNMNGAKLRSRSPATGGIVLSVPDGGKLDNVAQIVEGLVVSAAPTIDGVFEFTASAPAPRVLSVGIGAAIQNLTPNGSALILTPGGGAFTVFTLNDAQQGSIAPSTGPYVRVVAGDIVICVVFGQNLGQGKLPVDWIVGPVGATLIYQMGLDAVVPETPSYLGTVFPLVPTQSVTNPLAIKGAVRTLIYTSGPVAPILEPDTFDDWTKLYAVWTLLRTPKQIVVRSNSADPAHVPAGTWDMESQAITSDGHLGTPAVLILDDGAVLHDLGELRQNIILVGQSSSPSLTFSTPAVAGDATALLMGIGASIRNDGPSVMVAWDKDTNVDGPLLFGLVTGSFEPSTMPIVDVTPAGAFASIVGFFTTDGSSVGSNTLSGADAGGLAAFVFLVQNGQFDLNQANWTGSIPLGSSFAFQVGSRPRVNIQTDPVPTSSTYACSNGSEFVRVDPAVAGTGITVTLPDPRFFPDETVLVKKINADVAETVTVDSAGGGLIDGALTDVWPATAYFFQRYTSDGVSWWKT